MLGSGGGVVRTRSGLLDVDIRRRASWCILVGGVVRLLLLLLQRLWLWLWLVGVLGMLLLMLLLLLLRRVCRLRGLVLRRRPLRRGMLAHGGSGGRGG